MSAACNYIKMKQHGGIACTSICCKCYFWHIDQKHARSSFYPKILRSAVPKQQKHLPARGSSCAGRFGFYMPKICYISLWWFCQNPNKNTLHLLWRWFQVVLFHNEVLAIVIAICFIIPLCGTIVCLHCIGKTVITRISRISHPPRIKQTIVMAQNQEVKFRKCVCSSI